MKFFVYIFKLGGIPRYVGKGSGRRINRHLQTIQSLRDKKPFGRVQNWHYKVSKSSKILTHEIVYQTDNEVDAYNFELTLTKSIGVKILDGGPLWNSDYGGMGQTSEGAKRIFKRPELKLKASQTISAYNATPEAKARMRLLGAEVAARPGIREKIRATVKAQWADPGMREARVALLRAASSRPEVKARKSAAQRLVWDDPERRARYSVMALEREAKKRAQRELKA